MNKRKLSFTKIWQFLKKDAEKTKQRFRDHRGFALMYSFSAMILIAFIVMTLSKETLIDYRISTKSVDQVKAYYAAKAGLEISLLRIQIFRTAIAKLGSVLKDPSQKAMLDMVWQLPLPWPPVMPTEVSKVETDLVNKAVTESLMDSSYLATIADEGTKIDINDLASRSKAVREATRQQILNIFENRMLFDREFADRNRTLRFDEVVNHIQDYLDADSDSLNGGAEQNYYENDASAEDRLPPNRPFRTMEELRMVAMVNDEVYDMLKDNITIYGTKGINVNYAPPEVLKSLSPDMTDEMVQEIVQRRADPQLGPFDSAETFANFASTLGVSITTEGEDAIPILTDAVVNFRIQSQGISRGASREIIAVIYDFDKVKDRLVDFLKKEQPQQPGSDGGASAGSAGSGTAAGSGSGTGSGTGSAGGATPAAAKGPKGRPRIVFWQVK